ncbi:hypothetical protein IGS73_10565 [Janibacter indicus]|uniref:Holin n=1 Tax=Janibacter indicus TaxID=857417 RepID=A0A1L3MHA4_9MICO|nr:hypothetical protein [Janibacter indicus]APH01678.1 hypothetical protein ASJ30_09175 [Janibacter indicus]QOK21600.1 hypothetical protein IGS73_10565 [Janibacter indicus]
MQILTTIPAKYRKYVYALLALAALALSAYKASQGDWVEFAGLILGGLGFGTATANTPAGYESKHDDSLRA